MPDLKIGRAVTTQRGIILFILVLTVPALGLALWPPFDLAASGLFYRSSDGFFLADNLVLVVLHILATKGAWALGVLLTGLLTCSSIKEKMLLGLTPKDWRFLLLALLIGPVLIANVGLKDHWGRARPREVTEFGGTATFSPALVPQAHGHTNSSFIAGDAAFAFYLPSLAYVVTSKRRRRIFWLGIGAGGLIGFTRLAMGAHFLSDVLFAALLMLAASAILHALMFGYKTTTTCWNDWFSNKEQG